MEISSPILEGLNPAQRAAVVDYDAPSLIIAGAGSGKTRVLTSRIAYMIEQGVDPASIMALTFTNKAAAQMRERIGRMIPDGRSYRIRMGTFHSVFSRILRENADRLGYPDSYTIYEPTDSKGLIKSILKERELSEDHYKPNAVLARISLLKNRLITPGAYAAKAHFAAEDRLRQMPEFGYVYDLYCRRCKQNGAMDFDDLLLQTNILFRDFPDVLARYQEQYRYLLVDEYQDTNYAQYVIIRRLSLTHSRVCVVGDDAQSIYSFRGAKIENILSFRNDYPDAKVFKLEQNYRSTRTIVDAANSVIAHNARQMEKKCFSEGDRGEKIKVLRAYTDREEADRVSDAIRDRVRTEADGHWNSAAVLYRTNSQAKAIEDSLRHKGIPYRIYRGSSFYDHKEIKDLLGYLRLIINPRDDEAFRRIVNVPARGIGQTTVDRIGELARQRGLSMWEAVDALTGEAEPDPVQRTIVRKVAEFVALIRELSLARTSLGLYDFGLEVAQRSGILPRYRLENTPEAAGAVDNIEEMLNSMQLFKEQCDAEIRSGLREAGNEATVEEWMQGVMLMSDMDDAEKEEGERVTLMTVHSAKGLEYDYVYIVGMEENLFPSQRALEDPDGLEEERRLFYVALTRARKSATLSFAESRFQWGSMVFSQPSRFLREIDPCHVETEEGGGSRPGSRPAFGERPLRRPEGGGAGSYGGYGSGRAVRSESPEARRSAIEELRRRFDYRFKQQAAQPSAATPLRRPEPEPVRPPMPAPERLRRVESRPAGGVAAPSGGCLYAPGDRVEHPKFGVGTVVRIETLSADHKLIVDFAGYGEKTLLAKFAKLQKL